MAIKTLKEHMSSYKSARVALSSGKDSSTVAHLAFEAVLELKKDGLPYPAIIVTTSDTLIENPAVINLVKEDHRKIREFAELHGLDIQTQIVRPNLSSSFMGRVLGNGIIPAYGNMNRSCTDAWKITPQKAFIRSYMKEHGLKKEDVLTLVGSRTSESSGRNFRMESQGIAGGEVSIADGYPVLAPIYDWDTDDVFLFLSEINNDMRAKTYSDMGQVIKIYKDANSGSCPIVVDNLAKAAKPCGSRFGCCFCVAGNVAGDTPESINGDKSLEAMIQHEEDGIKPYLYLQPLADLQRYLASIQYRYDLRTFIGRAETLGKSDAGHDESYHLKIEPGIFSGKMLIEFLEFILTAQADEADYAKENGVEPRFELITAEEMIYIDMRQSMYGLTRSHESMDAYHRVINLGERFYPEHYTKTFAPRVPKPKTKHIKLDHIAIVESYAYECLCLSEDVGIEPENLEGDDFYSVSPGLVSWVQQEGAAILSSRFQKSSDKESRLSAFNFWINEGVKVSRRAINTVNERLILTEAVELQGLYDLSNDEIYSQAVDLIVDKRPNSRIVNIPVELVSERKEPQMDLFAEISA